MEYSNELYEILAHFQGTYREAMGSDTKGGIKKALQFKIDNSIKKFNETRKKEIELNNVYLPIKFSNRKFNSFFLRGANFRKAVCDGADFSNANIDSANFTNSQCKQAKFILMSCNKTDFSVAHCDGSDFSEARGEGAIFNDANCNNGVFSKTFLPGVFFVPL